MSQHLLFQYCQKIVVFRNNDTEILLCKRKGEQDYDGIFSFIGGKMEVTDENMIQGVKREKDEEVGEDVRLEVLADFHPVTFFKKKDGNSMLLPHYYARYLSGEVKLNDEYSEYKRVKIEDLDSFEPKIHTIPEMVTKLLRLKRALGNTIDYIVI